MVACVPILSILGYICFRTLITIHDDPQVSVIIQPDAAGNIYCLGFAELLQS